MASELSKILHCSTKKGTQPEKLDSIANYMDSILKNMKSDIQNTKKNKNSDNPSFNSNPGFQNFSMATIQNVLHPKAFPLKTSEANNKFREMEKQSSSSPNRTTINSKSTLPKPTPLSSKKSTISRSSNNAKTGLIGKQINKKVHKNVITGKMHIVREGNKIMKSVTSVLKPIHEPTVVSMEKIKIHHKVVKKTTSSLSSKEHGNNNSGQNNKIITTKTIVQQSISKPVAPAKVEKKNRNNITRPVSVEASRLCPKVVIDNKRRTVSLNNNSEKQVENQKQKMPYKKKIVPAKSPPEIEPSIARSKPIEELKPCLKIGNVPKDNSPPEMTVATVITHAGIPGPSRNTFNIIMEATPITPEGKPIKFMKNVDNKTKDQKSEKAVNNNTKKGEFNEMGDNSLKIINEKLQDIFNRIRDEKDTTTSTIKNCMIEKFGSPVYMSSEPQKQVTVIKPIINNKNNNNNSNNNNTLNNNSANNNNKITNIVNNNLNANINTGTNLNKIVNTNNNNNKQIIKNDNIIKQNWNINKQLVNNNINNNKNKIESDSVQKKISVQATVPSLNLNNGKVSNSNVSFNEKSSTNSAIVSRQAVNNYNFIQIPRKLSNATPMEIIQEYVVLVNKAKRDRKTYTVCGNYFSIRRAFIERGWIEKIRINLQDDKDNFKKLENLSNFELVEQMRNGENGEKCKRIFISKLLAGHQVDFYWDYQTNPFNVNSDRIKKTIINRFPFNATRSYTSKAGLCESLKEAYWYYIEGYSNILFPRTYNLAFDEELNMFVDDFRLTAAISLLSWVNKNSDKPLNIISPNGTIPVSVFNFATLQCYNYIKVKEHKDLDSTIAIARESEWDIYLEKFYKIIHQGQHFKESDLINAPLLLDQAKYILGKIKRYIPYISTDGNMNLWLLKPNNGSRGSGIHVCRTLKYALETVHQRKDVKYVIQKYIEKPLLIHNTKFDIRQWFLVTCMPNLQVWLYKDNYLRFSTQMYDLSKLHESIHLTNNSIQCRYRNNANRSNALPDQNMWHSDSFRKYLSDIGQPYAWRNIIYKGIKECLIGLFMLCQDKITTRINSFELCGADFMLAEDFRPYLIEINSRPALYPSTRITAQMCPKVLEDVVKVTVDYQRNQKASTGNFELIYKDNYSILPPKDLSTLIIEGISFSKLGKHVPKDFPEKEVAAMIKEKSEELTGSHIKQILNIDPNKVRKEVKTTLEKILAMIHSEQNQKERADNEEKHTQFRKMLSEFVDIISGIKTNK